MNNTSRVFDSRRTSQIYRIEDGIQLERRRRRPEDDITGIWLAAWFGVRKGS
jgi:hypothetical protein